MTFALVTLLSLMAVAEMQSSAAFSAVNGIGTGTIVTVSAPIKSSSDGLMYFSQPYTKSFPVCACVMQSVVAISSLETLSANEFSMNASTTTTNLTHITMKLQLIGNTYINYMRHDYLFLYYGPAVFPVPFLYYDCFLCSDLVLGSGTRSMIFNKQSIPAPTAEGHYQIQSMIAGLKFVNNKDYQKQVYVNSYTQVSEPYIYHNITTNGNSSVEWVCLSTIVVDMSLNIFYRDELLSELGEMTLDLETETLLADTVNPWFETVLNQDTNVAFYGLSSIQMKLGDQVQIVNFDTTLTTDIPGHYSALNVGGVMGYFYMLWRQCDLVNTLFSLVDRQCYAACPDGTFQNSTICEACDYTCLTCQSSSANCASCDASMNRDYQNIPNTCNCMDTYVDTGSALCQLCSTVLEHCQSCSSTTVCTACLYDMVFNTTSGLCECPVNEYFIANILTCVDYSGCLVAQKFSNIIRCTSCDTNNHFQLTNTVPPKCECMDYFELSTDGSGQCIDICGDGVSPYQNDTTYCDDGAQVSGDGCSDTCQVEDGYGCFNQEVSRSYCAPQETYTMSYLYAYRTEHQNTANFVFKLNPEISESALNSTVNGAEFKVYVDETSVPHTSYSSSISHSSQQSLVTISMKYPQTIEGTAQTFNLTLDPYKVSVAQKDISLNATGVNYQLTVNESLSIGSVAEHISMALAVSTLFFSLIFSFSGNKIQSLELLLSTQMIWIGMFSVGQRHSIALLSGLNYLAGYNQLQPYEISTTNYRTSPLTSAQINAEFCLNFNYMALVYLGVIFLIIPLKLLVMYKRYRRQTFTSDKSSSKSRFESVEERYEKLIAEQKNGSRSSNEYSPSSQVETPKPATSLKQLSEGIKWAESLLYGYIDRVYFVFGLLFMIPILVFFSVQLGFMRLSGTYELGVMINILACLTLLIIDFCFAVLVYQDTDKKDKCFNFMRKKTTYPHRLLLVYFLLACLYCSFLVYDIALYLLTALCPSVLIFVVLENPYNKWSLEHIDSLVKPTVMIMGLICLSIIKASSNYFYHIVFVIFALLFTSLVVSIARLIKKTFCKGANNDIKIEDNEENDLEKAEIDETNDSHSDKYQKKMGNSKQSQIIKGQQQNDQEQKSEENYSPQQQDSERQHLQAEQNQEDELARIKRELRADLKKRRGMVHKIPLEKESRITTQKGSQHTD